MPIHKNWISNRIVATGCNRDILGINKACKGWFQIHGLVNIRATLHILKWWSQLGGRTILIQDEAGCEATSVPGVSCSDLWHDEIVGQNQIMNTNKDCGSEWLMTPTSPARKSYNDSLLVTQSQILQGVFPILRITKYPHLGWSTPVSAAKTC